MGNEKQFIIYKIYYGDILTYIGQTAQQIDRRLHKHFFAASHIRKIDPRAVTKVEVANCVTRADMNVYEKYYIELLKPSLNCLEKDTDLLTIRLPDLNFFPVDIPLMAKWRARIADRENEESLQKKANHERFLALQELKRRRRCGEVSEDDYDILRDELFNEECF